ncbi:MAG: NAD(P)/FAD-dependent oxidoreductase [Clostridia bacterium]|nr:NAD(P)/FAD-dependent oxidoreductase [Clostridia bacterium]
MNRKKIIIIGAGPAGLTAGFELLKDQEKYEVIILEESQEIGGISRTVKYNNKRMDIGGHRFFSKDKRIMDFWKEIMPLQGAKSFDDEKLERDMPINIGGPNPNTENNVMLIRTRISRIYYLKKFFDYPISLKWATIKNMGLIRTLKAGFSYIKACIFKKNENSLEDFYINRFGKVLYSMFFEKYTEKLWGRHPSVISADWGAQRVKGLSIKTVLKDMFYTAIGKKGKKVETSLIQQFWYPKYGPGELWEELAKQIERKGGKIQKGYCVEKININNGKVKSVICKINGKEEEITGDIFISSMPLKDLCIGIQDENMPDNIRNIGIGLPYRDFITVGILVDKLNLKNKTKIKTLGNIIPDCWIYIQEPNVKMGRIQIFNNWSPYLLENPEKEVWIGLEYFCKENDEYWNMTDKQFIDFATKELISMNFIDKNDDIKDSHVERVKKAYPAYFDTYSQINKLIEHINKYDNLYCIGRNGQHRYNNMDHSMGTAFEAVKNIKNDIKDKNNIWSVNTEKEYHEEKK